MSKKLPDSWVRKAVYDAINNIIVDNSPIKCYDSRVTSANGFTPEKYVLMTTQTNTVGERTKCEWLWESSVLLDIVTTDDRSGNQGSRLEADNIAEAVRSELVDLELDVSSGLSIVRQTQNFPNDIVTVTDNEIVVRKFIRLELTIQ